MSGVRITIGVDVREYDDAVRWLVERGWSITYRARMSGQTFVPVHAQNETPEREHGTEPAAWADALRIELVWAWEVSQ